MVKEYNVHPINNLLSGFVQKTTKQNWKLFLVQNWQEIMGSLHHRVSLEQVYEDSVLLGVHDSSWMQELYMMSRLLLKKINDALDKPRIIHIRFKATGIKKSRIKQINVHQARAAKILSEEHHILLQKIKDPILKQALEELYKKCL